VPRRAPLAPRGPFAFAPWLGHGAVIAMPTAPATIAPTATTAPTATSAPAPTAPVMPTRAITPTATSRAVPVTIAPAATRGGIVRDDTGVCQLVVPVGYKVDSVGGGFDARDDNGFGVIAGAIGRNESPEALAQLHYGKLHRRHYRRAAERTEEYHRHLADRFHRGARGETGKGTVCFKQYGTTVCGVSMFTYDSAAVPHNTAASAILPTIKAPPLRRAPRPAKIPGREAGHDAVSPLPPFVP